MELCDLYVCTASVTETLLGAVEDEEKTRKPWPRRAHIFLLLEVPVLAHHLGRTTATHDPYYVCKIPRGARDTPASNLTVSQRHTPSHCPSEWARCCLGHLSEYRIITGSSCLGPWLGGEGG